MQFLAWGVRRGCQSDTRFGHLVCPYAHLLLQSFQLQQDCGLAPLWERRKNVNHDAGLFYTLVYGTCQGSLFFLKNIKFVKVGLELFNLYAYIGHVW